MINLLIAFDFYLEHQLEKPYVIPRQPLTRLHIKLIFTFTDCQLQQDIILATDKFTNWIFLQISSTAWITGEPCNYNIEDEQSISVCLIGSLTEKNCITFNIITQKVLLPRKKNCCIDNCSSPMPSQNFTRAQSQWIQVLWLVWANSIPQGSRLPLTGRQCNQKLSTGD